MTAEEVSQYLGLSVATLATMRARPGKDPIPFVKIGRLVRYRREHLEKWIQRNTFSDTYEAKDHRTA